MNDDLRDMIIAGRVDRRSCATRAASTGMTTLREAGLRAHLRRHDHDRGGRARDGAGGRVILTSGSDASEFGATGTDGVTELSDCVRLEVH